MLENFFGEEIEKTVFLSAAQMREAHPGPVYGDNVFEKCGINRDGAGEVGKPRYSNGKRHF